MIRKEMIAMILAGGQGARLKLLTKNIAKPAVFFGGKYRIIDFVLSNCSNSGIDTVGVLTQYRPYELNTHIGIGAPWDLDRIHGGVALLPPYTNESGGDWYKGTANAIYQNINFIDRYNPEYVLVLSGDHIYKMDYNKMLEFHKENNGDVTIAVIEVPMEEASRFGIMDIDDESRIIEFQEKPKNPKSNLASMGIYIFNWNTLKSYLIEDENNKISSHDFGKDVIPKILEDNMRLLAYKFDGYWKDVGTVESLWEANMDLLNEDNKLDIYDRNWKIYTSEQPTPPQYIGENAKIENSVLVDGCVVLGEVKNSVIFSGVYIGENSKVLNSVVMNNACINEKVIVDKAIIGKNVDIASNTCIGDSKSIALIGDNTAVESNRIL